MHADDGALRGSVRGAGHEVVVLATRLEHASKRFVEVAHLVNILRVVGIKSTAKGEAAQNVDRQHYIKVARRDRVVFLRQVSHVVLYYDSSVVLRVLVYLHQILERQMRKGLSVAQSEETGACSELEDREIREYATGKVSFDTPHNMPNEGLANTRLVAEKLRRGCHGRCRRGDICRSQLLEHRVERCIIHGRHTVGDGTAAACGTAVGRRGPVQRLCTRSTWGRVTSADPASFYDVKKLV